MDKQGQVGIEYLKPFVIGILVIAVLGMIILITSSELGDVADLNTDKSGTITNQSFVLVNATKGGNTTSALLNAENVVLSGIILTNRSSGETIDSANYTTSGGYLYAVNTGNVYRDVYVNLTASYTYTVASDARNLLNNVSKGTASFYSNAGTWFTLLAVVIIVLIIGIVIVIVNRFGGSGGGFTRGGVEGEL